MLKKALFISLFLVFSSILTKNASAVNINVTLKKYDYNGLVKIEKMYGGKHKAEVLRNLMIIHNNITSNHPVLPVPIDPVGSFHGKLKKLGTIKIVFGISGNQLQNVIETFGNIYYILRYTRLHRERVKIAVVFYGVVSLLMNNTDNTIAAYVHKYSKEGVRFYTCYNAMLLNNLVRATLIKGVKPVPMGILKIYQLKKEGYVYITNP
jgi:intracellular sulfur oxidation DsrE/DsrF family protein